MKHIPDLYFKATGDDKNNPNFQFKIDKVLDYSNQLNKGKIKYLETILKNYYEHITKKFEKSIPEVPKQGEKLKSDHQIIVESDFFIEIEKRIEFLKKMGENIIIEKSYYKVLENLAEQEKKYNEQKQKGFKITFDIMDMKRKIGKLKDEREKMLYLVFLKKELEELLLYPNTNQIQIIKKYKLEKDCFYLEKGKKRGEGILTFNDNLKTKILPFLENQLSELGHQDYNEFKLKLEKLNQEKKEKDSLIKKVINNMTDSELLTQKTDFNMKIQKQEEKIIWKKDKKDLIYLITALIELDYIAEHKHINKLISNHFAYLNKKETPNTVDPIQHQELGDLKSKIKNSEYPLQPSKEIKDVIKKLQENK